MDGKFLFCFKFGITFLFCQNYSLWLNSKKFEMFVMLNMLIEYIFRIILLKKKNISKIPSIQKFLKLVYKTFLFFSQENLPLFLKDLDPKCIILLCHKGFKIASFSYVTVDLKILNEI